MIYVVERPDGGGPKRLRGRPSVAAYTTSDAAERAAKALGGRVVVYSVAGSDVSSGTTGEAVAREYAAVRAERDALLEERRAEQDGRLALRARYGARPDETMGQWIARLHRDAQALATVRAALAMPRVLREAGGEP